jgi:hypothetical protein
VFNDYEEDLKLVINIVMQSTQIILLMFRMGMWKLLKKIDEIILVLLQM